MSDERITVERTRALIEAQQRTLGAFLGQQIVPYPPAQRALMIGPHPDDNLLGPGGVALKYVAAGIPVHWICLTDGRACTSSPDERRRLASLRPEEERECARRLGLEDAEVLALPEDRLTEAAISEQAVAGLRDRLAAFDPDAVFAPWCFESHPLHRYTAHLVARALSDHAGECTVYSWALGSLPPPLMLVDITAEFPRKCELMEAHASQLALHDYLGELRVLHQVLAGHALTPMELAEAYVPLPKDAYVAEILSLALDHPDTLACGSQPMKDEVE